MAKTNLSLGNLYRATQGTTRVGQVSMNAMNASAGTAAALSDFAINSVTPTVPTYTYIVESTTEAATFLFGSPGTKHATRVGSVSANYTVSFGNGNFSVGTPTLGASPSFPITPAAVGTTTYSEASSVLSMTYADGFNVNATGYNSTTTKTLYAVDVYNTINQPDFCLLFGTKVKLSNGTEINVEDLNVGDVIKAWVPVGLPDEAQPLDSENIDWRFYQLDSNSGSYTEVVVENLVFNFASGYYNINDGLIKSTGTHPLWVFDNEIQKYHFKNVENIFPGDKIVKYTEDGGVEEVEVYDIAQVTDDIEIVTINVENADVYLANGTISHNKGTTTQPYIPSSGLRMYLDPGKAYSFPSQTLPATGTPTVDFLDLTGYGTGFRPGAQSPIAKSGGNPSYNAGATKKDKYYSFNGSSNILYKDTTSNISGGYTQFNTSALSVIAWVRFTSHPANGYYSFFNKQDVSGVRQLSLFLNSNGSGNYFIHEGSTVQYASTTTALSLNTWYMISYTAALSGTNAGYIDNVQKGTISNGAKDYTTSALITIGGNYAENTYYFPGQIGPVLFYNRQLTASEISQTYDYFSPTYK